MRKNIKTGLGLGLGFGVGNKIASASFTPSTLDRKFVVVLWNIFAMPFYRIPKFALAQEHEEGAVGNLVLNIMGMQFLLAFIAMLHWWVLFSLVIGYFVLFFIIGFVRKQLRKEQTSTPEIDKDYAEKLAENGYYKYEEPQDENETEPIKARVEREFKRAREARQAEKVVEPKIKKTTKKSTVNNNTPDFDENDFASWSQWFSEHPDQIRARKS